MNGRPNIVLVHGAWADGSCWSERHRTTAGGRLPRPGAPVPHELARRRRRAAATGARVPGRSDDRRRSFLRRPDHDRARCERSQRRPVSSTSRPSRSTRASRSARSSRRARSRRRSRTCSPTRAASAGSRRRTSSNHFAADVDRTRARVMCVGAAGTRLVGVHRRDGRHRRGGRSPTWYLVAQNDEAIPPDAERQFAARMGATTLEIPSSHVAMVSNPAKVAELIEQAAQAVGATAAR